MLLFLTIFFADFSGGSLGLGWFLSLVSILFLRVIFAYYQDLLPRQNVGTLQETCRKKKQMTSQRHFSGEFSVDQERRWK